jgi:sugar lactone lactonase YvrE
LRAFLFFISVLLLSFAGAKAQGPVIAYTPATNNLTIGQSYTFTPNNTGGAVPATIYGQVSTLAGSGTSGFTDATGTAAQFNIPYTMVSDASGNLYVADDQNNAIRKVTPGGVVTTFAGSTSGTAGNTDNPIGTSALFNGPQGIAIDASGNLFVADNGNDAIRKITPAGAVTTFYSSAGLQPTGMIFDASGNLLVATQGLLSQIMSISPAGVLTSIAGNQYGYADGTGSAALFKQPEDVQTDASGNIFVADYLNNAIRKIAPGGVVTTFAGNPNLAAGYADAVGTAALFNNPTGVALGNGNIIYVADLLNNDIRKITPDGTVSLVAGSPSQASGYTNGIGTAATFYHPVDLYIDGTGTGYIADARNGAIRQILLTGYTISAALPPGLVFDQTTGIISGTLTAAFTTTSYTVTAYNAGGYSTTTITLSYGSSPPGLAPVIAYTPATNYVPVGASVNITPTNTGGAVPATIYGQVSTLAGSGTSGFTDATGTAAQFNIPYTMVSDASGNLYVADDQNNAIRKVTPGGVVTTFAGSTSGTAGNTDNPIGTSALFNGPQGIAIDASGNLFVADNGNDAIRKITPAGAVTTFYSSAGLQPTGMIFDASGNLLVATQGLLSQIMSISPAGVLTSIAGNQYGYADGTGSAALFKQPEDVQTDASGNIFVADYLNNAIRKIAPGGVVTTFAGNPNLAAGYADAVGTAALFNNPTGVALGNGNIIYVADLLNNDIRKITPDGTVSLVAGSPSQASGYTNGIGTAATFYHPVDLYIDGTGTGYIADARNGAIRQILLTGYTISAALPPGLVFDQTTGIISGTLTAPVVGKSYTVTAYNAYGYSTTVVSLSSFNNWTGGTTDWATTSNWSAGAVPAAGDIAQIGVVPYSGTAQPTVSTSTSVGSVILGKNNTPALTIIAGQTLTVTDSLKVDSLSNSIINGPGNISIAGTSLINNTASLTAALNSVITLAGSSTLTNNGTFTLASDANGSASIAAIPATSSVIGQVSVQRYLTGNNNPAYRSYRILSSPVNAGPANPGIYSINYLKSSIFLTGTDGVSGGFDDTNGGYNNPTLYLFRENIAPLYTTFLNSNWIGISNITTPPTYAMNDSDPSYSPATIPVGNGYLCYFRGGRDTPTPFTVGTPPTNAILTATGVLNQGQIIVKDWYNQGSSNLSYTTMTGNDAVRGDHVVGNPYASSIDWDTFHADAATATGIEGPSIDSTLYMLDPVSRNYGAYQAGMHGIGGTLGTTNIILSGQGFFVTAACDCTPQLIFNEDAKTSLPVPSAAILLGKPVAGTVSQYLRLKLSKDTINTDETVIIFKSNATMNYKKGMDAFYKPGNGAVSLSSRSADKFKIVIKSIPLPGLQSETLGLSVSATANGTYSLSLKDIVAVPQLFDVWLMDAYKKDSVNMRTIKSYSFDINKTDSATFGSNRFSLVIGQNPAYAYKLLDFTASKAKAPLQVDVLWKTQYEANYTNFTVERSTDGGKSYTVLGSVKANGQGAYSFSDKSPVIGQDLYRLKQEDINNTITYSKVVGIFYSNHSNSINGSKLSIYPNPANNIINLAIAAQTTETANYNIQIINSTGMVVKEITSSQPLWQGSINGLQPGTYVIKVFNSKDQSLVGRSKFVKL